MMPICDPDTGLSDVPNMGLSEIVFTEGIEDSPLGRCDDLVNSLFIDIGISATASTLLKQTNSFYYTIQRSRKNNILTYESNFK